MTVKPFIFSALSLFVLTSCLDTTGGKVSGYKEDGFENTENLVCFRMNEITKAVTETTTESLKTLGFQACALVSGTTYIAPSAASWVASKGLYTFSTPYYYPKTGTVDVFAASGASLSVASGVVTVPFSQGTALYGTDLIVSQNSVDMPRSEAVALTFNHVLAQVSTTFKATDELFDYYVKSCTVTSPETGTYSFASGLWTPGSDGDHQTYYNASGTKVTASGTQLGETFTCLPCSLAVTVSWECREKGTGTIFGTYSKTGDVPVSQGYRNCVIVTLTNDDAVQLHMTVDVNPWDAQTERPVSWNPEEKRKNRLQFTASAAQTVSLYNNVEFLTPSFQYSFDETDWTDWDYSDLTFGTTEHPSVYIRGKNPGGISSKHYYSEFQFGSSAAVECSGNIMSLLDWENEELSVIPCDYCFNSLFRFCQFIVSAPELPATTLADHCYSSMFDGCKSLTTAPELPATNLSPYCYVDMFGDCGSLTTAPELPATTLADHCYSSMFDGCGSLTTAPELPATTLADHCYSGMFNGCRSLTTAPELPATTLADDCYSNMFYGCTSLTTAPGLPATNLSPYCYAGMFNGCTSLTTAPGLPATYMMAFCYSGMFYGCTSLTTAPGLPATNLQAYCYLNMFSKCTSLTTAPELPATELLFSCYSSMFYGCISLSSVTMKAIDVSMPGCLDDWLDNAGTSASTPTLYVNPTMVSDPTITGNKGVFTVQAISK